MTFKQFARLSLFIHRYSELCDLNLRLAFIEAFIDRIEYIERNLCDIAKREAIRPLVQKEIERKNNLEKEVTDFLIYIKCPNLEVVFTKNKTTPAFVFYYKKTKIY